MTKVEFIFDLEQRVITVLGDKGIITSLAFDDGGREYCVKTSHSWTWWKENQLKPEE